MLKASSLAYATLISTLIGVISGSLILYAYLNRIIIDKNIAKDTAIINARSGINFLLSDQGDVLLNDSIQLSLYNTVQDSVLLIRKSWGAFEIGISVSKVKGQPFKYTALIGNELHDEDKIALFLSDQNRALSVCGKTMIRGISYIPKSGVKRAYIEGQTYMGSKLIYGETKNSERRVPTINQAMIDANVALLNGRFNSRDSIFDFYEEDFSVIERSFEEVTKILYSEFPIYLSDQKLSGNICLYSEKKIYVSSEASTQDVLMYAPVIEVEDQFKGNFQAFAYDTVLIGKKVVLDYPTVIGVIKLEQSVNSPLLEIGEETYCSGIVFQKQVKVNHRYNVKLKIGHDAIIHGQVYSDGLVEHKGKVYGSIVCESFTLSTPSSVYGNHLLNATIDFNMLSDNFVGINLVNESDYKKVVKWIH